MASVHILRPADPHPVRIRVRAHEPRARRPFIGSPRCSARPILAPTTQKTYTPAYIALHACSVLALRSTTSDLAIPPSHVLRKSLAHRPTTLVMPIHMLNSVSTTLSSIWILLLRIPNHASLHRLPASGFQPLSRNVCLPFVLTDRHEVLSLRGSLLWIRLRLDRT